MEIFVKNIISTLNTEFIQPNKDQYNQLKLPSREYPRITNSEWKEFVDRMLKVEFQEHCITIVPSYFVTFIL